MTRAASKHRWGASSVLLTAVAAIAAVAGCTAKEILPPPPVEGIGCQLTLTGVEQPAERARIEQILARRAVQGSLRIMPVPNTTAIECSFIVDRLGVLDTIHREIAFEAPGPAGDRRQLYNPRLPAFAIRYDTVSLGAAMEVVVRFRVTPGAKLFYKPEGEAEQDISTAVNPQGEVGLKVTIHPGQRFLYARSVAGNVSRYIRIDIFSQVSQEIPAGEYR